LGNLARGDERKRVEFKRFVNIFKTVNFFFCSQDFWLRQKRQKRLRLKILYLSWELPRAQILTARVAWQQVRPRPVLHACHGACLFFEKLVAKLRGGW
jgi:hypothetical protein